MLILSTRHRPGDVAAFRRLERFDRRCWTAMNERRADAARECIRAFVESHEGRCYVGVSWGKDSVVVAHLAHTAGVAVPFCHVVISPVYNPDCAMVRDAFLERFAIDYHEIRIDVAHTGGGDWDQTPAFARGYAACGRLVGEHSYISGIRGQESGTRKMRCRTWGTTSPHTCAPLAWWSGEEIFQYLAHHDLPVHPCYAMSHAGRKDRVRLRCDTLGRDAKDPVAVDFGTDEWEHVYYRAERRALDAGRAPGVPWPAPPERRRP